LNPLNNIVYDIKYKIPISKLYTINGFRIKKKSKENDQMYYYDMNSIW
jgi:hypothetical protein